MTPINRLRSTALIGFSDEWMSRSMETVFNEKKYQVTQVSTGKEALKLARGGEFDVIMLDERMDGLSGIEVCEVRVRNGRESLQVAS